MCAHVVCVCVCVFTGELTKPNALEQRPLPLDGLFDGSLSGAVETTLTTFDPVHQLDLLELRIESVKVPEHKDDTSVRYNMNAHYLEDT